MNFKNLTAAAIFVLLLTFAPCSALQAAELDAPDTVDIGMPFIIGAEMPENAHSITVSWGGKSVPLASTDGTVSALLATDIKNVKAGLRPLYLKFVIDGVQYSIKKDIDVKSKSYPSEKLTVAPKMVSPPKEVSERIKNESARSKKAIGTVTPGFAPKLPLVRPVPGIIVSVYGKSRYFNNELRGRHGGLDFRAPVGTPIKAVADGRVIEAGDFWFAGKNVFVDHGAGLISFYCHMSRIDVKVGDRVRAGDVIGLSGKTGRVTGPHLHLGMSWHGDFFDPEPLLPKADK